MLAYTLKVLIVIIVVLVILYRRRQRKEEPGNSKEMSTVNESHAPIQLNRTASIIFDRVNSIIPDASPYNPIGVPPPPPPLARNPSTVNIQQKNNWEIDYKELKIEHELGRGAFGVGK